MEFAIATITHRESDGGLDTARSNCHEKVRELQGQISGFVSNLVIIHGRERPGAFRGHEHFGYMDGISQPALRWVPDRLMLSISAYNMYVQWFNRF